MTMIVRELASGARAMTPWLAGVVPFGLVIGVTAAQADIATGAGWLTGPTIYGGSAQIATIHLLDAGAATATVITTVLVINLRLVLYSAAMANHWRGTPLWWRLIAGYLLVDPSFAVGIERYATEPHRRRGHLHYLGGAVVLWVSWMIALAVGAFAGASVPEAMHLELLAPLYLMGIVAPHVRARASRRAVLVSAAVAVAMIAAPLHLGIAIGIVAGLLVSALPARANPTTSLSANPDHPSGGSPGAPDATAEPVASTREVRS
jgi:predicted branched-subunit amino acid permease